MSLDDIPLIEANNKIKIRVYSLTENDSELYKSYSLSKIYEGNGLTKPINLLLFKEHFMFIKNMNKLLRMFAKGSYYS